MPGKFFPGCLLYNLFTPKKGYFTKITMSINSEGTMLHRPTSSALVATFLVASAFLTGRWLPANPARAAASRDGAVIRYYERAAAAAPLLHKVYSAYDFRPNRSDLEFQIINGQLSSLLSPENSSYWAALDLPNGAVLSEVTFYLVDNSYSANILLTLVRVRPSDSTTSWLLNQSSFALSQTTNVQSLSFPVDATIDNSEYNYYLKVELTLASDDHKLSGARVSYSLPTNYLPVLNR